MALTLTSRSQAVQGNKRVVYVTAAWDNSYASGGEALTAANVGLRKIDRVEADPTSGFSFNYDYTNSKLRAWVEFNTYTATVNPASHTAVTAVNTDVTVTGALTTDIVEVIPPQALEAGIEVQSAWVTSADTVRLRTNNPTAGAIDPASATWTFNLRNASGALKEVKSAYDLSAVTGVRLRIEGY